VSERSELRRYPARGSHEPEAIYKVLDAGFLCHLGFNVDGQPFVIPTLYGRNGDKIYLHGSAVSRTLKQLDTGVAACLNVAIVDGLVLARSGFHHSINYRSVVVFGTAKKIQDEEKKINALRVIMEHAVPARWDNVRPPTEKELNATAVLEFPIEEASAKIRTGPPLDDEEDYALPIWAGVLPLKMTAAEPIPDPRLTGAVEIPEYIRQYGRK
jgi:uncharacterized protein